MLKTIAYDALWIGKYLWPWLKRACLTKAFAVPVLVVGTALWHRTLPDVHTLSAFAAQGGYWLFGAAWCVYCAHACRRELDRR